VNPKQSSEYSERQRQRILDATWALFAERGYHETTMREIAAALGMTTGVLYTYFSGKEEILAALAKRSRARTAGMLESVVTGAGAREAIGKLFDMILEFWPTERGRLGVKANLNLMAEAGRREDLREVTAELLADMESSLARLTRRGVENGEFGTGTDPEALAILLGAVLIGLQTETVLLGDEAVDHIRTVRSVLVGLAAAGGRGTADSENAADRQDFPNGPTKEEEGGEQSGS
jgi:AcrR family transcriptional regulator